MEDKSYCVHIVVDSNYGERIRELPLGEPVWIIESDINRPVILLLRQEQPGQCHLDGITSFCESTLISPEDNLIGLLETIDLHHGEYSHDPPYSMLHVIGVKWSKRIERELEEYGFTLHAHTAEGFVAKRCPELTPINGTVSNGKILRAGGEIGGRAAPSIRLIQKY